MGTTRKASVKSTDDRKSPAKPVSLYPMGEEEAVKRLLRVPPPEKGCGMEGERIMSSTAKPVGGHATTKSAPKQAISVGAPMTLTITVTGNKQTYTEIRETKPSLR